MDNMVRVCLYRGGLFRMFFVCFFAFDLFSIPDYNHYIYFPILILEKEKYFPFKCSVLNNGTTGTIVIMSLV